MVKINNFFIFEFLLTYSINGC